MGTGAPSAKTQRPRLMPLKIPKPQGFIIAASQQPPSQPHQPAGVAVASAPPMIRVQRTSPGESDVDAASETADRLHPATLEGGRSDPVPMEVAPISTTTSSRFAVDSPNSTHLLTPPNTAKIAQPQSADVTCAGAAGLSFQTQSTPASPGSPLTPASYSPSVSKRGRTSAVSGNRMNFWSFFCQLHKSYPLFVI